MAASRSAVLCAIGCLAVQAVTLPLQPVDPFPKKGYKSCQDAWELCTHIKYAAHMQRFCPYTCNLCIQNAQGTKEMVNPIQPIPEADENNDQTPCVDDDSAVAEMTSKQILPGPTPMPWFKNWTNSMCQACCTCKSLNPDTWGTCRYLPCEFNSPYHCWVNIKAGEQMNDQKTYPEPYLRGIMHAQNCDRLPQSQFPGCSGMCEFRPPAKKEAVLTPKTAACTPEPNADGGWEAKHAPHKELEGVTTGLPKMTPPPNSFEISPGETHNPATSQLASASNRM